MNFLSKKNNFNSDKEGGKEKLADGGRRNGPLGGSSPRKGMMFVDEKTTRDQ